MISSASSREIVMSPVFSMPMISPSIMESVVSERTLRIVRSPSSRAIPIDFV